MKILPDAYWTILCQRAVGIVAALFVDMAANPRLSQLESDYADASRPS